MLADIGVKIIEELFASIPEAYRLKEPLNLPGPLSESEVIEYFQARSEENSVGYTSFLGAGIYNHLRSVVTDAILQRGEFLTSYTPYQAEMAQGTLQAIFEFQTMICQLTGQEVANASMYDGSTATTEAVLMAERLTSRQRVLVARSVHPEYRDVLRTYAKHSGLKSRKFPTRRPARSISKHCKLRLREDVCAVVVQSPNFFGAIESLKPLADAAHASGALLVVAVAEAMSLGAINPPREADIVAMEGQSFGLAPSYGGPFVGVLASRDKYVRQMPGRLVGQTTDQDGRRGFVLTLATREQHIRREKATSNICTNQALCALAATVHMCCSAKKGSARWLNRICPKPITPRRTGENSRREARFSCTIFQRIYRGASALRENGERRAIEGKDYRPLRARVRLSRTLQTRAWFASPKPRPAPKLIALSLP